MPDITITLTAAQMVRFRAAFKSANNGDESNAAVQGWLLHKMREIVKQYEAQQVRVAVEATLSPVW